MKYLIESNKAVHYKLWVIDSTNNVLPEKPYCCTEGLIFWGNPEKLLTLLHPMISDGVL